MGLGLGFRVQGVGFRDASTRSDPMPFCRPVDAGSTKAWSALSALRYLELGVLPDFGLQGGHSGCSFLARNERMEADPP